MPEAHAEPFVGPQSFGPDQTLYGRDVEISELRYYLGAKRIVLLSSPSGAGKSSLLGAKNGLLAKLEESQRFEVWGAARVNQAPDGEVRNRFAYSVLQGWEKTRPGTKLAKEALARLSLKEYVEHRPSAASPVLVIDQFEEVLRVEPTRTAAKHAFFDELGELLYSPGIWALLVIREDFLAALTPYARQLPTYLHNTYRIDFLRREDQALEAFTKPLAEFGRRFVAGVPEAVLLDLAMARGAEEPSAYVEPLQLQVVGQNLWRKIGERGAERLIESGDVGDVSNALAEYYDGRVKRPSADVERQVRDWIGEILINPAGFRNLVRQEPGNTSGLPQAAIDELCDAYLVRRELRAGATWLELAHDRLVRPIRESNRQWDLLNLTPFQRQADLWEAQKRSDDYLLRGEALTAARAWKSTQELTPVERDLLNKSEEADQARRHDLEQAEKLRAALDLATSSSLATRVLSSTNSRVDLDALLSIQAWRLADTLQSREALFTTLRANPRVKTLLHHRAAIRKIAFLPGASGSDEKLVSLCRDGTVWVWDLRQSPPAAHHFVAHHPDDAMSLAVGTAGVAATGGRDGTIRIWDTTKGEKLAESAAHTGIVNALSFDAEGELLASGGQDEQVRLWRFTREQGLKKERAEFSAGGWIGHIALSTRDRRVVVATRGEDWTPLYAWNLDDPESAPVELTNGKVDDVAFSATDRRFAAVVGPREVLLWPDGIAGENAAKCIPIDSADSGWLLTAAFRPDSDQVATGGSGERRIRIRVPGVAATALALEGHDDAASGLAFSPDGKTLASTGRDETSVWLWRMAEEPLPARLVGALPVGASEMGKTTESMVFDADGHWMACTAAGPRLISFARAAGDTWSPQAQVDLVQADVLMWRPDWRPALAIGRVNKRQLLFVGDGSGTLTMRDPQTLEVVGEVNIGLDVVGVAVNPSGTVLAVTTWVRPGSALRLYSLEDLRNPELLGELPGDESPLEGLAISPVEDLLAVGGNDMMGNGLIPGNRNVRLIDFSDPRHPSVLAIFPGANARRLTFSPDGTKVAVSLSGTSLWTVPPRPERAASPIQCFPDAVFKTPFVWTYTSRFSPDGQLLVSGGDRHPQVAYDSIQLGDPNNGVPFRHPVNFPWPVEVGGFDPITGQVILINRDGELWSLDWDPQSWVKELCRRAGRNLTVAEWCRYLGEGFPYQSTCSDFPPGN